MRSLEYIIAGKLANVNDCIHYTMKKEKPEMITITLSLRRYFSETRLPMEMIGRYFWKFSQKIAKYSENYGEMDGAAEEKIQIERIEQANRRLRLRIEGMERLGFHIEGNKIFEYEGGR